MKKSAVITGLLFFALPALAGAPSAAAKRCFPIGGSVLTNFGVIDANTTLGTYTGDLEGAVSARILSQEPGPNGTVLVHVQHFHVTATGDTVFYAPATLTGKEVAPGRVAVLDYPVKIIGGTGKYEDAEGDLNAMGGADFGVGHSALRYSGTLCLKK